MIVGIFHEGSGLGNQLFRYVFTRVKAADLGCDFGMKNPSNFKGYSFMDIDIGKPLKSSINEFIENTVKDANNVDIRGYDPKEREIQPFTSVEGEFQDEKYFNHHLDDIKEWLKVESLNVDKDICILAFRGGEYTLFPDLYLPREYWLNAMDNMRKINPNLSFHIVTDDIFAAHEMLPEIQSSHEIGMDWRMIRYAKYLILSNSSFNILPALLNENVKKIIAPLHWARHNIEIWSMQQNCYRKFIYQDKNGNLY